MDASSVPDIASKLFPNFWTWIVQLCSTGILLIIFKKYLWRPMLAFFEKRADYIEKNINDAKDMREKAQVYLDEADKQARDAAKQYRTIIDQGKEDANKQKQAILDEANTQARNKLEQARSEIELERAQAQDRMKEDIVDIATQVAEKIMDKKMDEATNDAMVKNFVDEVVH
ncbi:F0F1 ATP synthase subunit B [Sharpea azabuensis]|uniref:ATP synthase subunit b n=1 Tax=Sharpea azabuensis TaxID=322505 RepID=A0A1H6SS83_9FIRM|nr:F0F1 ATP synthase subunit B [Sharpea azabuensis]SEI70779.1 F-type H+-transporting ATPase subunit b [Sharpea azabuensis]